MGLTVDAVTELEPAHDVLRRLDAALVPLGFLPAQTAPGHATYCAPLSVLVRRQPAFARSTTGGATTDCWDLTLDWDADSPFIVTAVSAEGETWEHLLQRLGLPAQPPLTQQPLSAVGHVIAVSLQNALG
jgi:hypothetical protein